MRIFRIAESFLFALNVLIVFLLLFESRLVIPSWIQVIGRMHPMFLHFPIVIVLLAMVLYFFRSTLGNKVSEEFLKSILLLGAISSAITVIMGLFLSREEGYTGSVLQWHKWAGVAVSFLTSALYYYVSGRYSVHVIRAGGAAASISLLLAGHFGAELTHGEDFLFAPVRPVQLARQVPLEEAMVWENLISPIMEEKCTSCHNPSKAKGNLDLTTAEGLRKGGKSGKLWVEGQHPDATLLMTRVNLPESDKKHMPPKGKVQLTESEMEILHYWLKAGAKLEGKLADVDQGDTLRTLYAYGDFESSQTEVYTFPAASNSDIVRLNTAYRVVRPVALNSPALSVNLYNAASYTPKSLDELSVLQNQVVSLDLNKMPVKDDEIKTIAKFKNLRRLNLNATAITGATLSALAALPNLRSLSLSSTQVKAEYLRQLSGLKSLRYVHVWNTNLREGDLKTLRAALGSVVIESGFTPDPHQVLHLPPPRFESEQKIFTAGLILKLTHPVKGVTIRYTLDGTMPDSIHGAIYEDGIKASSSVTIKARAYKAGWFGSDFIEASFYKSSFTPDTMVLVSLPAQKYFAKGSTTLCDKENGNTSFGSYDGWLGFQNDPMELWVEFNKPTPIGEVTLSTRADVGAHIFPARRLRVWGGTDKNNLRLLGTVEPQQPKGYVPGSQSALACTFDAHTITYMKVIAEPVAKLPAWHQQKGQPGWLFVDEVLFN